MIKIILPLLLLGAADGYLLGNALQKIHNVGKTTITGYDVNGVKQGPSLMEVAANNLERLSNAGKSIGSAVKNAVSLDETYIVRLIYNDIKSLLFQDAADLFRFIHSIDQSEWAEVTMAAMNVITNSLMQIPGELVKSFNEKYKPKPTPKPEDVNRKSMLKKHKLHSRHRH